ncbi:MAG: hypothetical protein ABSH03_03220 [Candidatus Lustribacter sp.]|jgi:hypothetical protein
MNKIPIDTLKYATVVVRDAKEMARNHSLFYGIETWDVVNVTPERLKNPTVHGRIPTSPPPYDLQGPVPVPGQYGFITATGKSPGGEICFRLVQPTIGLSTFEESLVTRGQSVHSIFATIVSPSEFPALKAWLATEGVPVGQSYTLGSADYYYFDMRATLANFYIQVVVPHSADWETSVAADEVWKFDVERPPMTDAVTRATGISHFGVVVDDLTTRLERFATLFGQPVWRGMHWHTAPGSLEDTTNNGRPVNHGYFTGRADLGKNVSGLPFGFEVIQPTYGPSHYKEDFLQILGPGIHHVDVRVPAKDRAEFDAIGDWLIDQFAAPTCMSGWLRNHAAQFHYKDLRQGLGYVVEISAPVKTADNGPRKGWQPDYWYDFSAAAPA